MPAQIEIGGQQCDVIDFNMKNLPSTSLICKNKPQKSIKTEYYGNRGINFYRDNVYTSYNQFLSAIPSASSQTNILDSAYYNDTNTIDITIWFIGYFNPKKDSAYQFNLITNGDAQLFLSTDSSSTNKVLVASFTNKIATNQTVNLKSNEKYF